MSNSKIRKWTSNNKLLLFFILAALSLSVSTIALATTDSSACNKLIEHEEVEGNTKEQETNAAKVTVGALTLASLFLYGKTNRQANNKGPTDGDGNSDVVLQDKSYYRLPNTVEPKNYRLMLHPNMNNDTFDGSVMITLRVKQTIQTITLHSNNLTIHAVTLKNSNNQSIPILNINKILDKRELLIVDLEHVIHQEYYKLFILFSGRLDNKIVGLYGSRLKNGGLKGLDVLYLLKTAH